MHIIRLLTVLVFIVSTITLSGQDKFERQYRSFANQHLSTSMTAVGEGYAILSKMTDAEFKVQAANILSLDKKGKEDWSNTYAFDDSIAYMGEIIRLSDGNLVFSTILDKDSLNKVVTLLNPGGSVIWRQVTGQLTDVSSLAETRSTLVDIPELRVLHAHTISDSINMAQTIIQLSSYLYDGTSEFTQKWSADGLGSISIQDMITTVDSSVLILGQTESINSPFFLAKLDTAGTLIWTKSYKNNFGALEAPNGYRVTELIDSSFAILGSFAGTRQSPRGGFILNVSDRGEIIKGYRMNSLLPAETIYPTNIVGLGNNTVAVSVKRVQSDDITVLPSIINFDLDSIIGYQTSLDTCVNDRLQEGSLVSVDSMSASFLTTSIHGLTNGLTPFISKVAPDGSTFCEEPVDAVSFDSLGWSITDTIAWDIREMIVFEDSTDVVFRSYAGFDEPNKTLQDTTYCPRDPIMYEVDATIRGGIQYIWDDGNMDSIRTFTEAGTFSVTMVVNPVRVVDQPGTYSVMVTDNCMEAAMASVTLTDADFDVTLPVDVSKTNSNLCTDGTITLTADVDSPAGLVWSNGATDVISIEVSTPGDYTVSRDGFCKLASIQVTEAGTYSITVTGPCGDDVTEEIEISDNDITDCIILPPGEVCLRFPNVFIPQDQEELNKSFGPQIDCDVENYELHIYNRWGQDIWNTTNPETRWDGDLDGDPAPGDVYFWWAKYGDVDQEVVA